jgi:hypothetical protein
VLPGGALQHDHLKPAPSRVPQSGHQFPRVTPGHAAAATLTASRCMQAGWAGTRAAGGGTDLAGRGALFRVRYAARNHAPATPIDPHHAIPATTDASPCNAYSGQNATAINTSDPQKNPAAPLPGTDPAQRGHRHRYA